MIREVHVYGQSLPVGEEKSARRNMRDWERICFIKQNKLQNKMVSNEWRLSPPLGTREYYLERGFERGELYLVKDIL